MRQGRTAANGEADKKVEKQNYNKSDLFDKYICLHDTAENHMYQKQNTEILNWIFGENSDIQAWFICQIYAPSQHFAGNKLEKYWNTILIFKIQKPKMLEQNDT